MIADSDWKLLILILKFYTEAFKILKMSFIFFVKTTQVSSFPNFFFLKEQFIIIDLIISHS